MRQCLLTRRAACTQHTLRSEQDKIPAQARYPSIIAVHPRTVCYEIAEIKSPIKSRKVDVPTQQHCYLPFRDRDRTIHAHLAT
jgi:hypothetical protein